MKLLFDLISYSNCVQYRRMMLIRKIHVFELQIETKFEVIDQRAFHRPT